MDPVSGPEDRVYRSGRAQSVFGAYDQRDHAPPSADAAPSISCTDLRGSGRAARAAPSFCPQHMPPYVCSRRHCDELHLCRLYLDGFCPREDAACRWGHAAKSADNWYALEAYQLQTVPEHELLWLTRSLIRQMAPISAEEYRRELALCERYSADARCGRRDCFKIHLCPRLVTGRCQVGTRCLWTHRLDDPDNVMVLLRLKCADLAEDEVLARLARRLDDEHETVGSSSGVDSQLTAASSVSGDAAGPSHCRDGKGNADTSGAPSSASDQVTSTSTPLKSSADSQADGSSTDGASLLTSLDLCLQNVHPSVCKDRTCTNLHLCRLYIAGMCPYGEQCTSGHDPCVSTHNSNVMKRHMLLGVSDADVLEGLREGYLGRHPILVKERQMALQVCRPYQTGSCSQSDCPRLHICMKYAQETCKGQDSCDLSHQIDTPAQAGIIRRIGLDPLSVEELRNIFKNPVFSKDVYPDLVADSANIASEERGTHRAPALSRAPPLSGVSPPLPAPSDHTGIRRQMELQAGGRKLEAESATEGTTPQTSVDGPPRDVIESVGTSLDLCHQNIRPAVCLDEGCLKLHLCRLFIAGVCPYGKKCGRGHKPCTSEHNKSVLLKCGITGISQEDLLKSIRSGYLSRNPLTDAERHFALQVCRSYQSGSCKEDNCLRLHVCTDYVMGACSRSCGLSHQISSPSHAVIMRRLGLSSLRVRDVLEILQESASVQKRHHDPSGSAGNAGQSENHESAACSLSRESCSPEASAPQPLTQRVTLAAVVPDSQTVTADSDGQSPMLCDVHSSGGRCNRADCTGFHVCGYFLANVCQRPDESCPLGHTFQTEHNVRVMQIRGLVGGSPESFQRLLDKIALRARITFRNEAENEVQLCDLYNSRGGCAMGYGCKRFHICYRHLADTCPESRCSLFHSFSDYHNMLVRAALGLAVVNPSEDPDVVWATDRDLIELLRAKMALSPGVYPTEQPGTASSDKSPDVGKSRITSSYCATPILPVVCERYGTTAGCPDANCALLHICPHFLASSCRNRRCRPCNLEHRLSSIHNREVLRQAGRTVADKDHKELVGMLYDSSPHVRRTEVYERLRLCTAYNLDGCKVGDCVRIHICQKFIVGTCMETERCGKRHTVEGANNIRKLLALGLGDASDDEVLELLRAIHAGPSVSPNAVSLNETAFAAGSSATKRILLTSDIPTAASEAHASDKTSTSGAQPAPGSPAVPPYVDGPSPVVCQRHISILGCSEADCSAVHICPHFLAASCRRSDCSLGHQLTTAHNREALRRTVTEVSDLSDDAIVKMLYDASPHIRRTALYQKLRLCDQHGTTDGCTRFNCLKIHLCHSYLAGVCKLENCREGHRLEIPWNRTKLLVNGLEDASAEEVLEMLRAIYDCRSVCGSSLATGGTSPSLSGDGSVDLKATPSSNDGSAADQSVLAVCRQYGTITGCSDASCAFVHVCPHFVAGSCRRGERCQLDHGLGSQHNREVLRRAGHGTITETGLADLIKTMYATSSHIQRTEVYQKLSVCVCYNTEGMGCQKATCGLIHMCSPFVAGNCEEKACSKDHDIQSTRNKTSLDRMGLRTASSDEVLEMLRAVHAWRSMCGEPLATAGTCPADGDSASSKVTPPSSDGSAAIQSVPVVCQRYGTIAGCPDANCASVHICPHRLAGSCRRRKRCILEHYLDSQHNREALRQAGYETTTEMVRAQLIKAMYASSSHIRRTEVYQKLRVCARYNTKGLGCQDETCQFIHICSASVSGICRKEPCPKSHDVQSSRNKTSLRLIGLASASSDEVLEMLRAVQTWPSMCDAPLAAAGTSASPSHDQSADVKATTSSSDGAAVEQSFPAVCKQYGTTAGCADANCVYVHICPHFVAGSCRRAGRCQLGHQLGTQHNREVLRRAGHRAITPKNQHLFIQAMYSASPHIPRTEVYRALRVCDRHITKLKGCVIGTCAFIHICSAFVAGTCKQGARACRQGHEIETTWNRAKLADIGVGDASSDEVLEMLRAVHDWRSVCIP